MFPDLLAKVISLENIPSFQRYLYFFTKIQFNLLCFIFSFSEEDTAVIKSSLYFFEATLTFASTDEEFINLIFQLILFVLSKQSFSQDVLDTVTSKLVSLLKKFSKNILKTETLGAKKSLQIEIEVLDIN